VHPPSLDDQQPWVSGARALLDPVRRAAGPFPTKDAEWSRLLEEGEAFHPFSYAEAPHVQRLSPEDFVALVGTWSWIASLPELDRDEVLTGIRALVAGEAQIEVRYALELHWARKR
jgi:hypothetical protein